MFRNQCGDDICYQLFNNELIITGEGDMWNFVPYAPPSPQRSTDYETPWKNLTVQRIVIGEGVKRVGNGAFCKTAARSVRLPESLTEIGDWAFAECCALKSIRLPDSVERIGTHAFIDCKKLLEVSLPDNIRVGSYAFARTGIKRLTFRGRLQEAGIMAFWYNQNLTSLHLPSTGMLGHGLFDSCGLRTADLSESGLAALPDYMFSCCQQLENVILPPRVRTLGTQSFIDTGLTQLILPETVEAFHPGDIIGCSKLKKLVLLGKKAPACTIYTSFYQKDLVLSVPEDAVGYDVPPWSDQKIEYLSAE